ncbi:unnamed protein product [Zymoseptoria tritici ST99CH_3D1]|nr:unnamed protein product [Zymoseptoria tritici ST99CH_3D1]
MAVPITITSSSPTATQPKAPTSTHRLPTQSAADALQDVSGDSKHAFVSSGLKSLDHALVGSSPGVTGGFERGKVAEVWGPAGSGKTSLAFQAAEEAIKAEGHVVWLDCSNPLAAFRLASISPSSSFHYASLPTLSHLLSLTQRPPSSFPPRSTSLLIVDNLSTLLDLDYPRTNNPTNATPAQKWAASRRYAVLASLITSLQRLAAVNHISVLVTTSCAARMRPGTNMGAALAPGVGGSEWEAGIWSRIVMLQDFDGRVVGLQKVGGVNIWPLDPVGGIGGVIGVEIDAEGRILERVVDLTDMEGQSSSPVVVVAPPPVKADAVQGASRKRAFVEIEDSEEEGDEYGWGDEDDAAIVGAESAADPALQAETAGNEGETTQAALATDGESGTADAEVNSETQTDINDQGLP